jgi:hypothetical protein
MQSTQETHGPDSRLWRSPTRSILSMWGFPQAWEHGRPDDTRKFGLTFEVREPGVLTIQGESYVEGRSGAESFLTGRESLKDLLWRMAGPNPNKLGFKLLIWRGAGSREYENIVNFTFSENQLQQLRVFLDEAAGNLSGLSGLGANRWSYEHEASIARDREPAVEAIRSYAEGQLFAADQLIEQGACVEALDSLLLATEGVGVAEAHALFPALPDGITTGIDVQREHLEKKFVEKCIIRRKRK